MEVRSIWRMMRFWIVSGRERSGKGVGSWAGDKGSGYVCLWDGRCLSLPLGLEDGGLGCAGFAAVLERIPSRCASLRTRSKIPMIVEPQ